MTYEWIAHIKTVLYVVGCTLLQNIMLCWLAKCTWKGCISWYVITWYMTARVFLNKVKIKRDEYFMKSCDGTNMVVRKLLSILQFINYHNHVSSYIQNDHVWFGLFWAHTDLYARSIIFRKLTGRKCAWFVRLHSFFSWWIIHHHLL